VLMSPSPFRQRKSKLLAPVFAALLVSCGPGEAPRLPRADPTKESWYAPGAEQLSRFNQQAAALLAAGKDNDASAIITQTEGLAQRLISVPSPTYEATQAVSDRTALYGQMLMKNKHYGWARMEFQKNVMRWKAWQPQTPETQAKLRDAQAKVAACDRELK
jgi:hypothetical protein